MAMTPNPDFEHFVRDYLHLAEQERSPELRSRLLRLAREWMHAAMHEEAGKATHSHDRQIQDAVTEMDANSGHPWSEMDVADLANSLGYGNTIVDAASMLCRDEDEVRQKAKELGLVEHPGKRSPVRVVL
jgi:hypothetical protein